MVNLPVFATLVLFVGVLSGCRSWWESKIEFPGPRTGETIYIEQPFPANGWGVRVVLKDGAVTKVLYEMRGDVFLDFADTVWSPDVGNVTVFTCGEPRLRISYDLRSGTAKPFEQSRSAIAAHIRSSYHVEGSDRDVFEWACSDSGMSAFLHAHPGARTR